jgi:hypothetical protein
MVKNKWQRWGEFEQNITMKCLCTIYANKKILIPELKPNKIVSQNKFGIKWVP